MDEAAAMAAFRMLDLFAGFTDEQLRLLAFVCEDVFLRPDDGLYAAGDAANGAYVLVSGLLEAGPPSDQAGGRFRIEPISLVGEIGLMLPRPRATTVRAIRDSGLLFVPREPFLKLLRADPALAEDVAATLRAELARYLESIVQLDDRFSEE